MKCSSDGNGSKGTGLHNACQIWRKMRAESKALSALPRTNLILFVLFPRKQWVACFRHATHCFGERNKSFEDDEEEEHFKSDTSVQSVKNKDGNHQQRSLGILCLCRRKSHLLGLVYLVWIKDCSFKSNWKWKHLENDFMLLPPPSHLLWLEKM